MANYSFVAEKSLPIVKNGERLVRHNFTQAQPHTKIFLGITGLTFEGCALLNCDVPPDATLIDCSNGHASFCSHQHLKWLEKGAIPQCAVDCIHRTSIDTITIDGVVVDTINYYTDKGMV